MGGFNPLTMSRFVALSEIFHNTKYELISSINIEVINLFHLRDVRGSFNPLSMSRFVALAEICHNTKYELISSINNEVISLFHLRGERGGLNPLAMSRFVALAVVDYGGDYLCTKYCTYRFDSVDYIPSFIKIGQ